MDRTVTLPERTGPGHLIHHNHVWFAVAIHIGHSEVVVPLRGDREPLDFRARKATLPIAEQDHRLAWVVPRVDEVEIAISIHISRRQSVHAFMSAPSHDGCALCAILPEGDAIYRSQIHDR